MCRRCWNVFVQLVVGIEPIFSADGNTHVSRHLRVVRRRELLVQLDEPFDNATLFQHTLAQRDVVLLQARDALSELDTLSLRLLAHRLIRRLAHLSLRSQGVALRHQRGVLFRQLRSLTCLSRHFLLQYNQPRSHLQHLLAVPLLACSSCRRAFRTLTLKHDDAFVCYPQPFVTIGNLRVHRAQLRLHGCKLVLCARHALGGTYRSQRAGVQELRGS
mmetsp:Transcript_7034/g.16042  ORF Transcript_7034/g.16042 Transcript_7034/m.16042 type:complete len:217 (-) Transcript_7034:264-914(-)